MDPSDVEGYARSYIDAAIELQRRRDRTLEISDEAYESAVKGAIAAFENLTGERRTSKQG